MSFVVFDECKNKHITLKEGDILYFNLNGIIQTIEIYNINYYYEYITAKYILPSYYDKFTANFSFNNIHGLDIEVFESVDVIHEKYPEYFI